MAAMCLARSCSSRPRSMVGAVNSVCSSAKPPLFCCVQSLEVAGGRLDDFVDARLLFRRRVHFRQHVLDVRLELLRHVGEAHAVMPAVAFATAVRDHQRAAGRQCDDARDDQAHGRRRGWVVEFRDSM